MYIYRYSSISDVGVCRHKTSMYTGISMGNPQSLCGQESLARTSLMSQRSKKDPRSSFYTFTLPPGLGRRQLLLPEKKYPVGKLVSKALKSLT